MVVQGGIGLTGVGLGDTWILELSADLNLGTWHEVVSDALPPPRLGHTVAYIRENQVVLFGGRELGYDAWLLGIQRAVLDESSSLPRVGQLATLILGSQIPIYGGEDTFRHMKEDLWALDIKTIPSTCLQPWKRLDGISYRPKGRSFRYACADRSGRYIYVFGGMVDGLHHVVLNRLMIWFLTMEASLNESFFFIST